MADFVAEIDAWVEAVEGRADAVFRGIAERALDRVKSYTPVDTGLLRSAWSVAEGGAVLPAARPASAAPGGQPGGGDPALAAALRSAKAGDTLSIVNPTIYARAVEYGREVQRKDGTTTRTPGRGMLTRTVAELPSIAEEVIADVAGRAGRGGRG